MGVGRCLTGILGAAAGGITAWNIKPGERVPALMRVLVNVAPADHLAPDFLKSAPIRTAMGLSPDGQSLVFVGQQGGTRRLYLRRMDTLVATAIPGTENADSPFF